MPDTQRPSDWILPNYTKVTKLDYFGKPYEAYERIKHGPDYGKLWAGFSEQFRSQPTRDITNRSGSYLPPLDQIELIETKTDEI